MLCVAQQPCYYLLGFVCTGEAAAAFVQKWFLTGPAGALMKIVMLDILNSQPAELQPWFRETREAKFGKLEDVRPSQPPQLSEGAGISMSMSSAHLTSKTTVVACAVIITHSAPISVLGTLGS